LGLNLPPLHISHTCRKRGRERRRRRRRRRDEGGRRKYQSNIILSLLGRCGK